MKVYCVPISTLQPGQSVPKSSGFFEAVKLHPDKKAVEDVLESVRPPNLPQRHSAIYLFEDENQAKKWAVENRRPLYLVELEQRNVRLRTDWRWLQMIANAIKNRDSTANEMALNYWEAKPTEKPYWELLVASATVAKEIVIQEKEGFQLRELINAEKGFQKYNRNSEDYGTY